MDALPAKLHESPPAVGQAILPADSLSTVPADRRRPWSWTFPKRRGGAGFSLPFERSSDEPPAGPPGFPTLSSDLPVSVCLNAVQLRVRTTLGHQFFVRANLHKPGAIQHDD